MKKEIKAVHNNDLIELLKNLGLYTKLEQGLLKCKFTETVITLDNIHSIFPEAGSIKLVCNKPEAIRALSNYLYENNV
jgi:hypothetical protein